MQMYSLYVRLQNKRIRENSVITATRCGLDGTGMESLWGRDSSHPSSSAVGPTKPYVLWVTSIFPGVKRPGRGVDHPPHLESSLKKEYSYTFAPHLEFDDVL